MARRAVSLGGRSRGTGLVSGHARECGVGNRGSDQTRPCTVDEVGDDQIPHGGVRAEADQQDRRTAISSPEWQGLSASAYL